jgi:phosphatidyl-myo-inositol alpha-mannosyltransferase
VYVALVYPYDLSRPGGVRSHVAGLGEALVRRGHRVEVIAPTAHARLESLAVTSCGHAEPLAFGGTQIDVTWAPWSRVTEVARRGYDVMHFHTIWNPLMPFQLAAAYRGPRVATFHDVAGPSTPKLAKWMMPFMSEGLRRVALDRVIAVSPVVSRYLLPGKHVIIPNGISVPSLPPEGEREAILYIGRLEPRKGVATLIEAAAQLGADAPPVWIAGDGPLRADLERLAVERSLKVRFFGEIGEPEKWSLLRRAALTVAPAVGGESFGIVLLEAMAGGAPPLAADNPGYSHVLSERPELLFPAGDAQALARKVRALLDNHTLLQSHRAWGAAYYQQFLWPRVAERVEGVYTEVLRRA